MGKFSQPRGQEPQMSELDELFDQNSDDLDQEAEVTEMPLYHGGDSFESEHSGSSKKTNRKVILISICSVAAVLLIGIIAAVWYVIATDPNDGKILNNVTVAGVNIGNMTKSEAEAALSAATGSTYTQKDMVIEFPDATIQLSPADTGAVLDVDAAVDAAYDYGRTGTREEKEQALANSLTSEHPIALLPYLNLDLDYIRTQLDNYGKSFNSTYVPSSVTAKGEMPVLDAGAGNFDANAACQTLVVTVGVPGRYIDIENVYNRVLDAYSFNQFLVTVEMDKEETIPEEIDLEAVYAEFCSEPQDATVDDETYEVIYETYGYGFDLEQAMLQLEQSVYGDTFEIPLEMIAPKILGAEMKELLFRDVLASYETKHTTNQNRNTNLTLACAAINGTVLDPGEEFDYNTVVGERTSAKGYKAADAYSSGKTVQTIGGGVCQVSSTIYYCCLIADLEIVNRSPHSYVSSYMPMGMDATVSWGGPEFTFKNNTNYPIRIEAEVADGYVKIKLIGTDEKDYYVEMEYEVIGGQSPDTITEVYPPDNPEGYKDGEVIQTPYHGYTVRTYKLKYDKQTKELISREEDRVSSYKKRDKIVASIQAPTEPPTAPPAATNPPATDPPATPPPATEAPAPTDPPATNPPATEAPPPVTEAPPPATEAPTSDAPAA